MKGELKYPTPKKRAGIFSVKYNPGSTLGWSRRTNVSDCELASTEETHGRSLERHLNRKYFSLVDDGGKAITFPEWETLV